VPEKCCFFVLFFGALFADITTQKLLASFSGKNVLENPKKGGLIFDEKS